ncbi:class I SAM-dependent DNA methyltransferase [Methylobacterium sp. J-076]|uniref:class I SAM-dependent DNA methyltransferase n=1 Tax=Methylobacterium sp. J-076 TaxID=2836655 RepID=UPI001FB9A7C3|nr:DNA methyltransferase [Methylobacterium sp. J-076]
MTNLEKLDILINEAKSSGGSERSNYQIFIERLCVALGLPCPDMAREENRLNNYVFERTVAFKHPDGSTTSGFIDCYRKCSFILEAKQSRKRDLARSAQDQLSLLPETTRQFKAGHALRGTRGWDQVMAGARKQAENYARALPVEHGYPPFLLVVDVGHVVEVYADFSGQGKNYAQFPDRQSYRIAMDDLRDLAVQARLRAIWLDPLSLDPTRITAQVTRDIADRLARIAKRLEGQHDPKQVAEFLMRCLFTMFAEDVKLIPKDGFRDLLGRMRETPQHFVPALESLWAAMDAGGYAPHLNATLKRFNGALFKTRTALPLEPEDIAELHIAAGKDWSEVEPAIFGTLLERALNPRERSKLGAHYTPRAYVERLIVPTIMEPLRADWDLVQGQLKERSERGDEKGALAAALRFHRQLCTTRVLDPACGTGNFLYVALELMKKLEGEVLEAIMALGGQPDRYSDYPAEAGNDLRGQRLARTGGRFTVDPHQFHGLEINPRAVPIADLVLWIGYLKWQLKTVGIDAITEPVLDAYGTILQQDAVLAYDSLEMVRDPDGRLMSRWDGVTKKLNPITGEAVPDSDAIIPLYRYVNPRPTTWPDADFIVGNPPFIGTRRIRNRLGDGYVNALRSAYPGVVETADIVAYWWHESARLVSTKRIKRFGFITTNSITQSYNRPVLAYWIDGKQPKISLEFAIADHPWVDEADGAAVRISMTVAAPKSKLPRKAKLGVAFADEQASVKFTEVDRIGSLLQPATEQDSFSSLHSNSELCFQGVVPAGSGFKMTASEAMAFPEQGLLRNYLNGRDIAQNDRGSFIIDAFGISLDRLKIEFPATYQYLLVRVRPEREHNNRESYKKLWWIFAEPRPAMRQSLSNLSNFIGTPYTAKHRLFSFIDGGTVPDAMVYAIASDDGALLASLSSRVHVAWALNFGGTLENRPRYNNKQTFDPFPFPLALNSDLAPTNPFSVQLENLRILGNRLDVFRKERLSNYPSLTMTSLYNALERLREVECGFGPPLSEVERNVHKTGLISVLNEIHNDIDRTVLVAYGWDDLMPPLVGRPGATLPSRYKTAEQEASEGELLSRLVALNRVRAEEEKCGLVRWLRPDYQIPKLGKKLPKPEAEHLGTLDFAVPEVADRPKWPTDGLEQIRLVRDLLARSLAPAPAESVANVFDGRATAKRRNRVIEVLETLVATGLARTGDQDGQRRYFLPR